MAGVFAKLPPPPDPSRCGMQFKLLTEEYGLDHHVPFVMNNFLLCKRPHVGRPSAWPLYQGLNLVEGSGWNTPA